MQTGPGRYDCIYQVQKPSGDTYEITRKIIVKEAGKEGESPQKEKKQKKEIKSGEEDAEPDGANIDTSALKEEEGVFVFRSSPLLWNRQGKKLLWCKGRGLYTQVI